LLGQGPSAVATLSDSAAKTTPDNNPDYAKIHSLVAEIADNDCFGKGDELLNNVVINIGKWNIEQSVIDDYVAKLTKFYYGENS